MTTPAQAVTPDSDAQSAAEAVALELAARDLYDTAIEAGADAPIWATLREQHESYAQRLAGIVGVSANTPDADLLAGLSESFAVTNPGEAAVELENSLVAGHTGRLAAIAGGTSTGDALASAFASIVTAEARQATVVALLSGVTDAAALYVNPSSEAGA
ncbi:MAG TPA: hypothetical protein VNQ73_14445 [Ilumatobacter sp.]|nr:hypothetical protein [Ilumatobacter sp.]